MFAALFSGGSGFFLAADKVQVKYEMLWTRLVDGLPVSEAAAVHGYSRAAFYLVATAFDRWRGRRHDFARRNGSDRRYASGVLAADSCWHLARIRVC